MTMEAVIKPTDNEIIANALDSLSSSQKQMILERQEHKEIIKKEKYKYRIMFSLMLLIIVLLNVFYINILNRDRYSHMNLISQYNVMAINNKSVLNNYKQREKQLTNRLNYMNMKAFQYVILSARQNQIIQNQKLENYASRIAILDTVQAIYLNNPDVIPEYLKSTKERLTNPQENN